MACRLHSAGRPAPPNREVKRIGNALIALEEIPLDMHREIITMYPSPEIVLDHIIPNYLTGLIYGCLVEAYASEHNARMMAMGAATDSAKDLIRDLSITEVIGGARAQKKK